MSLRDELCAVPALLWVPPPPYPPPNPRLPPRILGAFCGFSRARRRPPYANSQRSQARVGEPLPPTIHGDRLPPLTGTPIAHSQRVTPLLGCAENPPYPPVPSGTPIAHDVRNEEPLGSGTPVAHCVRNGEPLGPSHKSLKRLEGARKRRVVIGFFTR